MTTKKHSKSQPLNKRHSAVQMPTILQEHESPHVALLVETSLASGREILLGIARYVREHRPWILFHEARSLDQRMPGWLKDWKGHGIIARIQSPDMARALKKVRVPVIDVLGLVPDTGFPLVHVDDSAIGHLAAGHLLDRGLRHFAFVGIQGENWSSARENAFRQHISEHGFSIVSWRDRRSDVDDMSWEVHQEELKSWLLSLPKPTGIMVCSDQRGSLVLDACRRAAITVPDEIAIIGVDNDVPLCGVCNPPLSSVWPNHALVGYEAAALLENAMRSGSVSPTRTFTPPKTIITRQSTDLLAVSDTVVAHALRVIRQRAIHRARVDDIAVSVGVSRSVLQRRFRAVLQRSVNDELVIQRIKYAQNLLITTQLALPDIAERSGFQHQEYMAAVFRQHVSCSPASFRKAAMG